MMCFDSYCMFISPYDVIDMVHNIELELVRIVVIRVQSKTIRWSVISKVVRLFRACAFHAIPWLMRNAQKKKEWKKKQRKTREWTKEIRTRKITNGFNRDSMLDTNKQHTKCSNLLFLVLTAGPKIKRSLCFVCEYLYIVWNAFSCVRYESKCNWCLFQYVDCYCTWCAKANKTISYFRIWCVFFLFDSIHIDCTHKSIVSNYSLNAIASKPNHNYEIYYVLLPNNSIAIHSSAVELCWTNPSPKQISIKIKGLPESIDVSLQLLLTPSSNVLPKTVELSDTFGSKSYRWSTGRRIQIVFVRFRPLFHKMNSSSRCTRGPYGVIQCNTVIFHFGATDWREQQTI